MLPQSLPEILGESRVNLIVISLASDQVNVENKTQPPEGVPFEAGG